MRDDKWNGINGRQQISGNKFSGQEHSRDHKKLGTLRNRTDIVEHQISDIELKLAINKMNSDKNMTICKYICIYTNFYTYKQISNCG